MSNILSYIVVSDCLNPYLGWGGFSVYQKIPFFLRTDFSVLPNPEYRKKTKNQKTHIKMASQRTSVNSV